MEHETTTFAANASLIERRSIDYHPRRRAPRQSVQPVHAVVRREPSGHGGRRRRARGRARRRRVLVADRAPDRPDHRWRRDGIARRARSATRPAADDLQPRAVRPVRRDHSLVLVCVMYIGFSAGGTVLAGQAIAAAMHTDNTTSILVFSTLVVLLTGLGYRIIHAMGRVSSIVGTLAFLYLFASLLHGHALDTLLANRHFTVASFLLGYLAVGFVADRVWTLCRGLFALSAEVDPRSRRSSRSAAGVGAQISMAFGVFAAALAGDLSAGHEVSFIVGLGATGTVAARALLHDSARKATITTLTRTAA